MKKTSINYLLLILTAILTFSCTAENKSSADKNHEFNQIKANFQSPERASGVNCWWWWLNGNVNKAAITKDLEAMKSRNFQGTAKTCLYQNDSTF